jgi:hypothetical protein
MHLRQGLGRECLDMIWHVCWASSFQLGIHLGSSLAYTWMQSHEFRYEGVILTLKCL